MAEPELTRIPFDRKLIARLFANVRVSKTSSFGGSACWEWFGGVTTDGYAQTMHRGKRYQVHRLLYQMFVQVLPDVLKSDHLCRYRRCVNPAHIDPVSDRENILRGEGVCAKYANQTHCKHGHEYTVANTYLRAGKNGREQRHCRRCVNDRYKRFHAELKNLPLDHPKRIHYRNMPSLLKKHSPAS